jgi:Holliday junction resolvase RusA-like endonuclease
MIEFFVPGIPRPKQSVQADTRPENQVYQASSGKYRSRYFKPKRVLQWENTIKPVARNAIQFEPEEAYPIRGYCSVQLAFILPDKHKRDLDNLSKAVLDALNGIIFEDDNKVVDLVIQKRYNKAQSGVFVRIEPFLGSVDL